MYVTEFLYTTSAQPDLSYCKEQMRVSCYKVCTAVKLVLKDCLNKS